MQPLMPSEAMAEFILRQPIPNSHVNCLLSIISANPISNPSPNLKRALILRSILSTLPSISIETLDDIERLQVLENPNPSIDPSLLRNAYLHTAIAATLAPLKRGDLFDFMKLVVKVWVQRMGDMERFPAGKALLSEEIGEWRKKMEKAARVQSSEYRDELLVEWNLVEGVEVVKKFLKAEFEAMEPRPLAETEESYERLMKEKGKMPDEDMAAPEGIPTHVVQKVRSNLRKSLKDLHNVVDDPLPHAIELADNLIARNRGGEVLTDQQKEKCGQSMASENNVESTQACASEKATEVHSADEATGGIPAENTKDLKNPTKGGIMDRNTKDRNPMSGTPCPRMRQRQAHRKSFTCLHQTQGYLPR